MVSVVSGRCPFLVFQGRCCPFFGFLGALGLLELSLVVVRLLPFLEINSYLSKKKKNMLQQFNNYIQVAGFSIISTKLFIKNS